MKYSYPISIILALIWIFSLFFFIVVISGVFFHDQISFHFDDFKKEKVYVDTLQFNGSSKGGRYLSYSGYSNKRKSIIYIYEGKQTIEELEPLFEEYKKNGKYLNIWVSPNTKDAYFDTPALNNTTQLKLWYQPLKEIGIFILMTFIMVSWSKYFKKELSKYGLTTKEFHKLREEGKLNEYLNNYEKKQT